MIIRPATAGDIPQLLILNNENVPAVSPSDVEGMGALLAFSYATIVVVDPEAPETVLGFAILMRPGLDYASENYRWFEARGSDFLYVDRIVIADGARDAGLGRLLYTEIFAMAAALGAAEVACEVNVDPPNPGSLRFHGRLGFGEVGRQVTKGDTITVAMLVAAVAA